MKNGPIIVTPWYCSYRLLEQSLRRNKPLVGFHEWWILYGRYPMLGVTDGLSATRSAQNLCKELQIEWWDCGEELPAAELTQKWALEVGSSWQPDRPILMLAHDAAPSCQGFLEMMEREMAGRELVTLASKATSYPGVTLLKLREIYANRIAMPKAACLPKKLAHDQGGPESLGGCYPDALYDAEWFEWSKLKDAKPFRVWLQERIVP